MPAPFHIRRDQQMPGADFDRLFEEQHVFPGCTAILNFRVGICWPLDGSLEWSFGDVYVEDHDGRFRLLDKRTLDEADKALRACILSFVGTRERVEEIDCYAADNELGPWGERRPLLMAAE